MRGQILNVRVNIQHSSNLYYQYRASIRLRYQRFKNLTQQQSSNWYPALPKFRTMQFCYSKILLSGDHNNGLGQVWYSEVLRNWEPL